MCWGAGGVELGPPKTNRQSGRGLIAERDVNARIVDKLDELIGFLQGP